MAAGHAHGHEGRARADRQRLAWVAAAGAVVMAAEVYFGLRSNSLVLLADAGHYATDIGSLLLAILAAHWALKAPTPAKTYGYARAEVLMAFVQALALWAISAVFVWQAIQRLRDPPEVEGPIVLLVGAGTLLINTGLALALRPAPETGINLRAAYLHVLSDALGSAAAVLAGALVAAFGWDVADPLLTLFTTLLILVFTWRLTRQSLHILLEGTPGHAATAAVEALVRQVDGVQDVHDLHVWTHTSGVDSLTVHVVGRPDAGLAQRVAATVREAFGIHHITVQVESTDSPCDTLRHGWI
ncbi:MAG TPA: cation diffusion facilitator family transporter [Candidatus Thermoplasmatota archaeon]|nr:cation diffusion facilitator family transporter [Candidatus Thermoplasmatota archaeon]